MMSRDKYPASPSYITDKVYCFLAASAFSKTFSSQAKNVVEWARATSASSPPPPTIMRKASSPKQEPLAKARGRPPDESNFPITSSHSTKLSSSTVRTLSILLASDETENSVLITCTSISLLIMEIRSTRSLFLATFAELEVADTTFSSRGIVCSYSTAMQAMITAHVGLMASPFAPISFRPGEASQPLSPRTCVPHSIHT
mmetsp:Transcript_2411/g.4400  ORF Transcript_2411/g.4400 Transcript_2411/m.4400 type:complete len:201 (-) Transcript_2411:977-1579(-)